jgi:hypothetical protein
MNETEVARYLAKGVGSGWMSWSLEHSIRAHVEKIRLAASSLLGADGLPTKIDPS